MWGRARRDQQQKPSRWRKIGECLPGRRLLLVSGAATLGCARATGLLFPPLDEDWSLALRLP